MACLIAAVRGFLTDLPMARRAIIEMTGVILLTPIFDIMAGTLVEPRISRFDAFPALLVIIPPLVSNAGALGGFLSSRLSSKLHLGIISVGMWPEGPGVGRRLAGTWLRVRAFALVWNAGIGYGAVVQESWAPG